MLKRNSKGQFIKGSSGYWKNKKLSKKHKEKMSATHKELCANNKNIPPSRLGKSPNNKGKSRLDMLAEKNHNWKGGISKSKRPVHSIKYKNWRKKVFEKDNYTCQDCGIKSGLGKAIYLEAHHIKGWADYPKLRYKVENGLTLCKSCHNKTKKRKEKIC